MTPSSITEDELSHSGFSSG